MKSRKLLITVSIVLISLGIQLPAVNATVVERLSDEDLVNQAQMVLTGTCTSITSEWNEEGTQIITYITISPQNFIKSDGAPREITIEQLGGEVGDIGMRVEGTSVFEEGEEVLLFLRKGKQKRRYLRKGQRQESLYIILGLSQGKYSIETDAVTGKKRLYKKKVRRFRNRWGYMEKKIIKIRPKNNKYLNDYIDEIQNIIQKGAN